MRAPMLPSCVLGWLAIASACSYSPHPKDGEQECYRGACVDGYVCGDDNRCYSAGYLPGGDQGGAVGTGDSPKGTGGVKGTGGWVGSGGSVGSGGKSSGGVGTGGASGMGGTTACQPGRASGAVPLIDDMADGDAALISQDGRTGGWFSFNDETGVQTPTPPAVTVKPGWICTAGSGFATWGVALGVALDSDETKSCNYDVSAYQGIRFAIQGTVSGGRIRFGMLTSDIANQSTTVGGTCVSSSTTKNDCDDAYGIWMTNTSFSGATTVSCHNGVSTPWTCSTASTGTTSVTVSMPFSSMRQEGWGRAIALNLAHVLNLEWQAKVYYQDPATGITSNLGPTSFDLCIGNLSFY